MPQIKRKSDGSRFDGKSLFIEKGIPFLSEGDRHCREGWLQLKCCCGRSKKWHLGYSLDVGNFVCWNCGAKPRDEALQEIFGITKGEAIRLLQRYRIKGQAPVKKTTVQPRVRKVLELPEGCMELTRAAKSYLRGRQLAPGKLVKDWDLKYVGGSGWLRNRILAPIYFRGELVSYQTRDITDPHKLPYIACPKADEVIHHKHIVYGFDNIPGNSALIVEGIVDTWKFGLGTVCTFGSSWTPQQVEVMSEIENKYILYDPEEKAQDKAQALADELSAFPGNVELLTGRTTDPGDFAPAEALKIKKDLGI